MASITMGLRAYDHDPSARVYNASFFASPCGFWINRERWVFALFVMFSFAGSPMAFRIKWLWTVWFAAYGNVVSERSVW